MSLDPLVPPPVFLPLHHPPGKIPEPQFYAEPHTYEEPGRAGRSFTREIEASRIHIEKIIGSGEPQGCEGGDITEGAQGRERTGQRERGTTSLTRAPALPDTCPALALQVSLGKSAMDACRCQASGTCPWPSRPSKLATQRDSGGTF